MLGADTGTELVSYDRATYLEVEPHSSWILFYVGVGWQPDLSWSEQRDVLYVCQRLTNHRVDTQW